jgi:hypothetical protein
LFAYTLALPAGLTRLESGSACVFAPNPKPDDYVSATRLPRWFSDRKPSARTPSMSPISKPYVTRVAPRYTQITAPTVIITGDSDSVVLAHIHSEGAGP